MWSEMQCCALPQEPLTISTVGRKLSVPVCRYVIDGVQEPRRATALLAQACSPTRKGKRLPIKLPPRVAVLSTLTSLPYEPDRKHRHEEPECRGEIGENQNQTRWS